MKFLVYIFLFHFIKVGYSQTSSSDTTWFDMNWREISKQDADFYRVVTKKTDNVYLVGDYYLDGKPQMIAEASQVNPLVKNGLCTYYYKNLIKASYGRFKNGKKDGTWVEYFNCQQDSSVLTYLEDGTKSYLMKSKYEDVFTLVEEMPEFSGGQSEMVKFIQTNLVYPKKGQKKGWEGKVFLKFIIDETGKVVDPKVLKSTGHQILDDEALRVISLMPNWKPGKQNGKEVRVYYNLPINFTLR